MKKYVIIIFISLSFVASAFILPRAIMSHRIGIFYNSLTQIGLSKLDSRKFNGDKLKQLLSYLHHTTNDLDPNDAWVHWKLISNGGACNHLSDMYTYLVEPLNYNSHSRGLVWSDGSSKHTLPFTAIKNSKTNKVEHFVYDPYYGDTIENLDNVPVSVETLCNYSYEQLETLSAESRIYLNKVFRPLNKETWKNEKGLSIYCNNFLQRGENIIKKNRSTYVQKFQELFESALPEIVRKNIYILSTYTEYILTDFKILLNKTHYEFPINKMHGDVSFTVAWNFINARMEHLFLNLEEADDYYEKVITSTESKTLKEFSLQFKEKTKKMKKLIKFNDHN